MFSFAGNCKCENVKSCCQISVLKRLDSNLFNKVDKLNEHLPCQCTEYIVLVHSNELFSV